MTGPDLFLIWFVAGLLSAASHYKKAILSRVSAIDWVGALIKAVRINKRIAKIAI